MRIRVGRISYKQLIESMMNWSYRFTHLGLTFGLIWNYIKGGKSTPSRLVAIILWATLMLAMLYVLSLWLSVPTYTHFIYLDRLFSERPPFEYRLETKNSDYFVSADYQLSLSSGASAFKNTKTTRFREIVSFKHEKRYPAFRPKFVERYSWASMELNNHNPQAFNEVLSEGLSLKVQQECAKKQNIL